MSNRTAVRDARDLSDYLARRLDVDGGAPAVTGDAATLTYAELADRAAALATTISPLVEPGAVVALDATSHALGLVAALAADRLGVAFLPLDTTAPTARQEWVVRSSGARAVLHQTGPLEIEAQPVGVDRSVRPLADPGYVIYTSGTTGRPKGVHVPKRSLVERLEGLRQVPGIDDGGSVLALSALSFDMSIVEVLLPLAAGGAIVGVDLAARRSVQVLDHALRELRPDIVQATPSFWRLMLASGWAGADVTIWCGGEAMNPELAAALHGRCAALWNLYGPTEATVWASAWRVVPGQPISLGTALPGTTVELVDATGTAIAEAGVDGEIRISGAGIADGYLAAAPAEDARFHRTPGVRSYLTGDRARRDGDGELIFLGRLDTQVKVRGHRVEIGEIESTLESHPAVAETIVVFLHPDDPARARLAAAVVTRTLVPVRELRRWLAERLPAVMVPQTIEIAEALPRTSAGKLDRTGITRRMSAGEQPA